MPFSFSLSPPRLFLLSVLRPADVNLRVVGFYYICRAVGILRMSRGRSFGNHQPSNLFCWRLPTSERGPVKSLWITPENIRRSAIDESFVSLATDGSFGERAMAQSPGLERGSLWGPQTAPNIRGSGPSRAESGMGLESLTQISRRIRQPAGVLPSRPRTVPITRSRLYSGGRGNSETRAANCRLC